MTTPFFNRLIAINDMLNSPLQMVRKEAVRLFFALWQDYKNDEKFWEEVHLLIQKQQYLIQELIAQFPGNETEFDGLQNNLKITTKTAITHAINPVKEVTKKFYVLNDQPGGIDRLNYSQYANAFSELILNPEMTTPITVGIYGHWGRGKSFLMQKILENIKPQEKPVKTKSQKKKIGILAVNFNAWSYSGSEHLWAGMVTHLYNEVEKHLGWKVPWHRFTKAIKKSWRRAISLSFFYVLLGLGLSLLFEYNEIQGALKTLSLVIKTIGASIIGGSALASLPILWSALKDFTDTLFLSRAKNLQNLAARPDFREQIGIMADIKSEISFISETLNKSSSRLVLFIDDLDRCDHKKAVEVLQAIMLLLADKDGSPFVIFLGIDARIIVRAIEENYGQVLVGAGITGYEYLDKIIQLPFVIPPADPADLKNYIESLLWASDAEREIINKQIHMPSIDPQDATQPEDLDPQIKGDPIESQLVIPVTFSTAERETIMRCVGDFSDNPRKIKRIMNMYRLVRMIPLASNPSYEKTIRWITMIEQWPLHTAWIIHSIEDVLQSDVNVEPEIPIKDIYLKVKKYIHSEAMAKIFSIDYDPTLFDIFIEKEPGFKVLDVLNLLPITFNLNPAIRWEVANFANRVVESPTTQSS